MCMKSFVILIGILTISTANSFQRLFPEQNKLYTYILQSNVSTGTQAPIKDSSYWTLNGRLSVQVYDDFGRARFKLDDLKTLVSSKNEKSFYQSNDAAEYLKKPWEVGICFSAIHVDKEPVWVTNMKRALSFNFLLSDSSENSEEPCLYGICMTRYSWVGNRTRKYNNFIDYKRDRLSAYEQRHCPNKASESWYRPFYSGDKNYVMTAERVYELDSKKGLKNMELNSDFQYRAKDNHILTVSTQLSLKYESDKPVQSIQKLNLAETSIQYVNHNYTNPYNDIRNSTQTELKSLTYKTLLKIARKGIDADNIVRNASLIHSLDFINLLNSMSQLNYTMLSQLFEDVLGTSYELETSRNIFLEVLPYVRSDSCARLIRHLITEQKAKIEDATLVSLIRKLPFNVVEYSRKLLEELELFTKLGPDFPQEIRHAGILSFATLVSKTLEVAFDQQYLDDIYDKYLRMYNNCPQYLDRLVWLQGLTNIGKSVKYYLDEIHTDNKKDRHERLWAGLASLNVWKESTFDLTLPIIMNETEHIQLRIVAVHAFLSTPLAARDFLNVHHYIQSCNNDQLKRFWYTTVQSLKSNRFYNRYKSASYYIPYLTNQVTDPGSNHWGTNNYIVSQEPSLEIHGPTFQVLTVGGPWNGPPELVMVEFSTGGEQSLNAALYIIAEGVTPNVFKRLQNLNLTTEDILSVLKDMKVKILQPEKVVMAISRMDSWFVQLNPMVRVRFEKMLCEGGLLRVHIDIVIKIYDKTVYATHIDQSRFDSWNAEDFKKSVEDFARFGSHINQQLVNYPIQMVKDFPTEIGTPIRLESIIVSFTSIRGNLTAPSTDDMTWRNDLHIRYQGTSVASLSTDGPLQPSEHTVRVQQSMVVHLPIKFDVTIAPSDRSLEFKWTNPNQNGGLALHSRTQIETESNKNKDVYTVTTKKNKKNDEGIYFDCENPLLSGFQVSELFSSRHANPLTSLQPSQLILSSLRLITSKTSGSCGIILPPKQLQSGNIMKLIVKLDDLVWNDGLFGSFKELKVSYGLRYYRQNQNSTDNYIALKGYSKLQSDGKNGAFNSVLNVQQPNADAYWKNLTLCFREQHNVSTSQFNVDFTSTPVAYKGYLAMNYSHENNFECFSREPSDQFVVHFDSLPAKDDGVLKFYLQGQLGSYNGHPQMLFTNIDDFFDDTSVLTESFWPHLLYSDNTFRRGGSFKKDLTFDKCAEKHGKTHMKVNGTKDISGMWTGLQVMKKFGFYHECRIDGNEVHTFSGIRSKLPTLYKDILLVADCTDKPRFAITLSEEGPVVHTNNDHVVVNGQLKNRTKSEGLTMNASEVIFKSKLTGVNVYHRSTNLTVILVPHGYMGTVCGACTGAKYGTRVF